MQTLQDMNQPSSDISMASGQEIISSGQAVLFTRVSFGLEDEVVSMICLTKKVLTQTVEKIMGEKLEIYAWCKKKI